MPWVFDIKKDSKLQESIPIPNSVSTMGREGCDINLKDVKASRHHCTLYVHDDNLTIVDNSSTNGTFVNGRKIERRELKNNDTVIIGITEITVRRV